MTFRDEVWVALPERAILCSGRGVSGVVRSDC
jgi:hypothetical protein